MGQRREPKDMLTAYTGSDDIANWKESGLIDYEVPGNWLKLFQDGQQIGRIRIDFRNGDWHVDLDGQGKPFTVSK